MYQWTADDPRFDILLERSGRILRVSEYQYESNFLGSMDAFSATYYSENNDDLRRLEMQPVTLMINDRPQMIGRIDCTTRGDQGSAVQLEGRDYISDLVECNLDPKFILKTGELLDEAIIRLFAPCGITSVIDSFVRNEKRTGKPSKRDKSLTSKLLAKQVSDAKQAAGRGLYEVGEELLARFGLFIQPALSRESIVIQAPSYNEESHGRIIRTKGSAVNNIVISGTARRDYSSFPTNVVFTGKQGSPVEKGGSNGLVQAWNLADLIDLFPQEMRDIISSAISYERREPGTTIKLADGVLYRLLYHRDDSVGKTHEQVRNALSRAVADRLKETLTYTCKVRGHVNPATGYTWANDTILTIDDDMADVHEDMWCYACTYAGSKKEGPTTMMKFLRPSAFTTYWL